MSYRVKLYACSNICLLERDFKLSKEARNYSEFLALSFWKQSDWEITNSSVSSVFKVLGNQDSLVTEISNKNKEIPGRIQILILVTKK